MRYATGEFELAMVTLPEWSHRIETVMTEVTVSPAVADSLSDDQIARAAAQNLAGFICDHAEILTVQEVDSGYRFSVSVVMSHDGRNHFAEQIDKAKAEGAKKERTAISEELFWWSAELKSRGYGIDSAAVDRARAQILKARAYSDVA